MPKKKKTSARRAKKQQQEEVKSNFLVYSVAIAIVILAGLMLIGGFGTGGPLPVALYHGVYWLFGWAGFVVPI